MTKSHICAVLLLLIGIVIMAVPAFLEVHDITQSNRRIEEFMKAADINEELHAAEMEEKEKKAKTKNRKSDKTKKGKTDEKNEDSEKMESIVIDDANAIGVISIPAIKLQYLVYEGTSDYILSKGIGHYETSGMFGEEGNCVLAGHTGSYDGVFFDRLPDLQSGNQIIITDVIKKTYTYSVEICYKTSPDDESIAGKPSEQDEKWLTLVTCADGGQNRYVCRCKFVE